MQLFSISASPQAIPHGQAPVSHQSAHPRKGRGALSNTAGRYEVLRRVELLDDSSDAGDWDTEAEGKDRWKT